MKLRIRLVFSNIGRKRHPISIARRKKNPPKMRNSYSSSLHFSECVRCLWDNFKGPNIHIIVVPEVEEKKQGIGKLFEQIIKITSLI